MWLRRGRAGGGVIPALAAVVDANVDCCSDTVSPPKKTGPKTCSRAPRRALPPPTCFTEMWTQVCISTQKVFATNGEARLGRGSAEAVVALQRVRWR